MIQLKKTILTLVALLAVTTGAWAQSPTIYFQQDYATETVDWSTATGGRFTPIVENGYLTVNQNQRNNNGTTLTSTATQGKVDAGKDFTMTFNVKLGASTNQSATAFNIYDAANSAPILSFAEGSAGATAWKINGGTQTATVSAGGGKSLNELSWIFVQVTFIAGENAKTYLTLKDEQNNIIDGFDKTEIPTLSVAGGLGKMTFVTSRYSANFAIDNVLVSDVVNDAVSGPEVDWNAAKNTGTFTMPGGNVTLEPEYYPQATVADGGVTPADADARATTDDPLVKVDATKLTGAKKLMYFVSNSGTNAPAYDAEGWTDQLPTAEGFTQQGIVYVYYYPVGTDEGVDDATATYSDGDMNATALEVNIAAAPTYAVTFAEGVNPAEPAEPEWTADPNTGVKKGQQVTVTYTGTKKVIGVKAEKKAAESLIVNPEVGQYIGSDGKNYDANATLPDGVTKVAMIAYVGNDAETSTTYNHGLALALEDVSGKKAWCSQKSATCLPTQYSTAETAKGDMAGIANTDALVNHTGHTHAAASAARNYNSGTHPAGTSAWFLPSAGQWDKMANAAGDYATLRDNAGLNEDDLYLSSTEYNANFVWDFNVNYGDWGRTNKDYESDRVRACLAF